MSESELEGMSLFVGDQTGSSGRVRSRDFERVRGVGPDRGRAGAGVNPEAVPAGSGLFVPACMLGGGVIAGKGTGSA